MRRRAAGASATTTAAVLVAALLLALIAVAVAAASPATTGRTAAAAAPRIAGCPVFPATSAWNTRVDRLPIARDSARLIASIGLDRGLHPDFGAARWEGFPIGIPITVVTSTTPRSAVVFDYADESDRVRYPIPAGVGIEGDPAGDGDRHALLVDRSACRLYELYALRREGGRWTAGSGAVWDLRSNRQRPAGWTSADAAGLPILPGLARYEEVKAGAIEHALRFTAPRTRRAYVPPARHHAGASDDPALPPMGLRVRLRASYPVASLPPQARIVALALQRYGMLLADNGSPWYITGAPDRRWDDDDLRALKAITGADLEVVGATR